jgi:(4-alkanoyl-5-oxo-2,5-dihydrofuran-3-yl)methyl phosphate reductase
MVQTGEEMILVTGATGTVGREVVAQLIAAGEKVRAMTRNAAKAGKGMQAEIVEGDFGKPETLARALAGADRVFSLSAGPMTGVNERNLGEAARSAGVRHIVKLSALGGDDEVRNDIRKWHDEGEQALRETGIGLTVLRPTGFMSNALHWRDSIRTQDKVFSNYGEGKLPVIHPRDIAAVAVRALTSEGHEGKAYSLTGPEALSVGQQVDILAETLGRNLEYVSITDEVARQGMERAGMPGLLIDALLPFAGFIRSGAAAQVFGTVGEVTGRPALTFRDWARENAGAFQ